MTINKKTFAAAVRKREAGAPTPIIVRDTQVEGLALAVNKRSEAWRFQYKPRGTRPDGKRYPTRTLTLGNHAELTLEEARAAAVAAKAAVRGGADPVEDQRRETAQRVAERQAQKTCRELMDPFMADFAERRSKARKGRKLDEAYVGSIRRGAEHVLSALGVMDLTPDCITIKPLRALFRNHAGTNWNIRYLAIKRFLDYAVTEEIIDGNIALMVERPATGAARARVLSAEELHTLWHEAENLDPVRRDFLRFMICVPCRISEGLALTWDQIDADLTEWTQPDTMTKNGVEHRFALPPQAREILERRREANPKGPVFPNRSGRVFASQSNLNRIIHEGTPSVTDWTIHDLRRTFASLLGESGASFPESVVDAVLNHMQSGTRGGVLGVYQRAERRREQAAVMMAWGRLLASIIDPQAERETVVALGGWS